MASKSTTTSKVSTVLTGGALYRAALVQLAKAAGWAVVTEGGIDTLTKGAALLLVKSGSNGVLTSVTDKAGQTVVKPNTALRWESAAQLVTTGKLNPAAVKPVVLTKSQRGLVTEGKLTSL